MAIESITAANSAMTTIYLTSMTADPELDPETRSQWLEIFSVPVAPQAISEFGEFIYARSDEFSSDTKAAAAEVMDFATMMGWWELGKDLRGFKISKLFRGQTITGATPVPYERFKAPVSGSDPGEP